LYANEVLGFKVLMGKGESLGDFTLLSLYKVMIFDKFAGDV